LASTPPPTGPQQARARATRALILESARHLFDERGVDATSVEDIRDAAAVSRGAFYYHFASKEQVLVALANATGPRLQDEFEWLLRSDAATTDVLAATVHLFADELASAPRAVGRGIATEMVRAWTEEAAAPSPLLVNLRAVVVRGRERREVPERWDPDDLATVLFGAVVASLVEWLAAPAAPADALEIATRRRVLRLVDA
jgi:AcrR family transcriptional regulator